MRRRILAAVLAGALLCGCAPLEEPSREEESFFPPQAAQPLPPALPETFALPVLAGQPLNPLTCPDGMQQTAASLLYEGLFRLDAQLTPQKLLCADWQYDAGRLTYTLTLRTDVTFSDGTAMTAADAAASLKAAMASPRYAGRLSVIRAVSAAEKDTVVLRLHAPHNALPALLDVPVFRAGTQERDVPLGTGPYFYDAESAALLADPAWWQGAGQPVERIALLDTADRDAMLYRFQAREVQAVAVDLTGSEPVTVSGGARSADADTTVMQYIGVNVRRVESAALRRCLSLGIGREELTAALLSGHARGTQFPVSPVSPLYPRELE